MVAGVVGVAGVVTVAVGGTARMTLGPRLAPATTLHVSVAALCNCTSGGLLTPDRLARRSSAPFCVVPSAAASAEPVNVAAGPGESFERAASTATGLTVAVGGTGIVTRLRLTPGWTVHVPGVAPG